MARLVFPDEGSRLVYRVSGGAFLDRSGTVATFYTNAAATVLANIAVHDGTTTPGAVIAGSTLTVDANSMLPLFWGPDGVDTLWAVVSGGPVSPVYARTDDRLDAIVSRAPLNVKDYGAIGDGVASDLAAINAAIAAANAKSNGAHLIFPSGKYKLTGPMAAIDLTRVTVEGQGAVLDCSSWAANTGALFTAVATTAYEVNGMERAHSVSGLTIKGPGPTVVGNTCISLAGADAFAHAAAGLLFRECAITGFATSLTVGANAYMLSFDHITFDAAVTFVNLPVATNSGERINFTDCVFNGYSTGGLILSCANQFADVVFVNCSLDYCNRLVQMTTGHADFIGCHMEFGNYNTNGTGAGAPPNALITITGDGADLRFIGGSLVLPGVAVQPTYIVDNASAKGTVSFRDTWMSNPWGSSNFFNSPTNGLIAIDGYRPADFGVVKVPILQGARFNSVDGTNEATTVTDPWWIRTDPGVVTGRLTSTNTNLSTSTTTARTGTRSLRIATGPATGGAATLFVPVKAGQVVLASTWYAKPGTQTGDAFIYTYWVSAALSPTAMAILRQSDFIAGVNITLTAAAIPFTQFTVSTAGISTAPAWATHFILDVALGSMGAGDFYLDDTNVAVF